MGLSIVVQCRPAFNWFVVKDCCVVGSSMIVQCRPVFNGVVVRYSSGVVHICSGQLKCNGRPVFKGKVFSLVNEI